MLTGRGRRGAAIVAAAVLLVSGLSSAPAQAAPPQVQVAPRNVGDTAVHDSQQVVVSGTAQAGARVERARFLGQESDGDRVFQDVPEGVLNRVAVPPADFLRNDNGRVTGLLTVPCLFAEPFGSGPFDPDDPCGTHDAVRLLSLEVTVSGERGTSNTLRVDYTRPLLLGYALLAPDRIEVRFDEPVRHKQGDSPSDFTVEGPARRVLAVEASSGGDCRYPQGVDDSAGPDGCTRVLRLDQPLGEDDQPVVTYTASDGRVPGREKYVDQASNQVLGFLSAPAQDLVLPRIPVIERVASRPPQDGDVTGSEPAPVVELGRITDGHLATVYVESGRTPGLQPDEDRAVGTATASGGQAQVPLTRLGDDAVYGLLATATDRNGNESAAASVRYTLDSTRPVLVGAVTVDGDQVVVTLSEPVTGTDNPADWTITAPDGSPRPVTTVRGSGATRTLSSAEVPVGSRVRYAPSGPRYRDAAGNTVPDRELTVDGVAVPVVTVPAGRTVTAAQQVAVRGTAQPGRTVLLWRDAGNDGTPDGEPQARTVVAQDGGWELPAALLEGAANDFVVAAQDGTGTSTSPPADVPTVVQDAEPPVVEVLRPARGEVLAGGQQYEVRFTYRDANPAAGPVTLEYSPDDGTTWRVIAAGRDGGSFTWQVPDAGTERGRVRATGVDAAGRRAVDLSDLFAVDALPPVFSAVTRDARTVLVTFAEPVSGRSEFTDWRVKGSRTSAVTEGATPDGRRTVTLTTGPGVTIGNDERPEVTYDPTLLAEQYRDRALQPVPPARRTVLAADGILPAPPTVDVPDREVLTRSDVQQVSGQGEPGTTVRLVDLAGQPVSDSVVVDQGGGWTVQARLAPDVSNRFRAVARDASGNTSTASTAVPVIEQDASDPAVRVTEPAPGTHLAPRSRVAVRWTSSDRNLVDRATTVQVSTDGGRSFTVLGEQQPASGSLSWDVPDVTTSDALVLVSTPDRAGRTGTGSASRLSIGEPAPAGSPSAGPGGTTGPGGGGTASPSPSASPSAGLPSPGLPPVGTFTAVAPARLLDTRTGEGAPRAAVGPGGTLRLQVAGAAGLPRTGVQAVVLNVTAVQPSAKTHVTVVPTGRDREATASLTAARGVTTATMVTARLGADGSVELRNEAGSTHLVADVFGWYAAADGGRGAGFAPLAPQRLLDTREGLGAPRAPVPGQRPLELQVTGRGGVPADGVTSVVLNLVAVHPSDGTHVTAWAAGADMPGTSNLNALRRTTAANLVTVPVGRDGKVALQTLRSGHLVADVFGWYGAAATDVLVPVDPARLEDTRERRQPLQAGDELVLRVAGRGGVPATGATAVVLTVSGVAPSRSTHLTLYAGGARTPETGNINIVRGQTATGQVIVPVGPDGTVRVRTGAGAVHVVADVAGWFRRG